MRENKICFHEKSLIPKLWKSEKKIVSWKIIDSWIIEVKKKKSNFMENHGKKNESTYLFSRKSEIHNSWILDEKKKKKKYSWKIINP